MKHGTGIKGGLRGIFKSQKRDKIMRHHMVKDEKKNNVKMYAVPCLKEGSRFGRERVAVSEIIYSWVGTYFEYVMRKMMFYIVWM